jgi:hypothetical protein
MTEQRRDDETGAGDGAIRRAAVFSIENAGLIGQAFAPIEHCAVGRVRNRDDRARIANESGHLQWIDSDQIPHRQLRLIVAVTGISETRGRRS